MGSYECGCPDGYQFDQSLSVCVQSGGGCSGAPCAFGCSPGGGPLGYRCSCPRGYQSIGDGHCVATVNPSSFHALARDWDLEDYEEGKDDFISAEGCFSCQMNGGSRPRKRPRRRRRPRRSATDAPPPATFSRKQSFSDLISPRSEGVGNFGLALEVRRDQTRNRQRLMRLQPSRLDLARSLRYSLVNDTSGKLVLRHVDSSGIWELFFKTRVDTPQDIEALISGDMPGDDQASLDNKINALVRITVV